MKINIGTTVSDYPKPYDLDMPAFLKQRLLITANSGGGKSWLLRRLAEQIHRVMPVIIVDPEGEFATLREKFNFVLVGKGGDVPADCRTAAVTMQRLLELRASAVFDLYEMPIHERHRFVRLIAEAAIEAPKNLWRPTTFMFDEVHTFCPSNGKGESEAKNAMLGFPTRGRKRQFGSIFATQRLHKLDLDARAEMLNRMAGMMFEPDDIAAGAEMFGIQRNERDEFRTKMRTMDEGHFFGFGRALTRETTLVKVGPVETTHEEQKKSRIKSPPAPHEIKLLLPKLADLPQLADEQAKTTAELKAALKSAKSEIAELRRAQPKETVKTTIQKERIITPGDSKRLTKLVAKLADLQDVSDTLQNFTAGMQMIRDELRHFKLILEPPKVAQFTHARDKTNAVVKLADAIPHVKPVKPTKIDPDEYLHPNAEVGPNTPTGGALETLKVCAQFPGGADDSQIAVMVGKKSTSRKTFRSTLINAGLIEKAGAGWRATAQGLEVLGPDFEPLPTGAALQDYWRQRLTGGELVCFETFVEQYPNHVTNEMLMEATGLKGTSCKTFKSSLRARRIVEGDCASSNLFD